MGVGWQNDKFKTYWLETSDFHNKIRWKTVNVSLRTLRFSVLSCLSPSPLLPPTLKPQDPHTHAGSDTELRRQKAGQDAVLWLVNTPLPLERDVSNKQLWQYQQDFKGGKPPLSVCLLFFLSLSIAVSNSIFVFLSLTMLQSAFVCSQLSWSGENHITARRRMVSVSGVLTGVKNTHRLPFVSAWQGCHDGTQNSLRDK